MYNPIGQLLHKVKDLKKIRGDVGTQSSASSSYCGHLGVSQCIQIERPQWRYMCLNKLEYMAGVPMFAF